MIGLGLLIDEYGDGCANAYMDDDDQIIITVWHRADIPQPTQEELDVLVATKAQAYRDRQDTLRQLAATDAWIPRVCEDVIDTMVANGLLSLSDLPAAAVQKLEERQRLRASLSSSIV